MAVYKCPICESNFDVADNTKPGQRLSCPTCSAQLALRKHRGKLVLTCPTCKEEIFDPQNCEECETKREKQRLLNEGRL